MRGKRKLLEEMTEVERLQTENRMLTETGGDAFGSKLMADACFTQILVLLGRAAGTTAPARMTGQTEELIPKIISFLNSNYQRKITLDQLFSTRRSNCETVFPRRNIADFASSKKK